MALKFSAYQFAKHLNVTFLSLVASKKKLLLMNLGTYQPPTTHGQEKALYPVSNAKVGLKPSQDFETR